MTDIITTNGKNVILNRAYKTTPDYTIPSNFKLGINNGTPIESDTDLDSSIPITDGTTNDDGSNTLTGLAGGDNSTDNTTTFKEGAGNTDVTAQNLIANATNVSKFWAISDLSVAGTVIDITQYFGMWFYIKDATTLAKFRDLSPCVQIRLGSDSSNFYLKNYDNSELSVGWNWLTDTGIVSTLTQNGTPTGTINYFGILINTVNATDTFVAGDVIYDLLRQWETSDLLQTFVSGYPTFNESTNTVTIRCYIDSLKANGFLINSIGLENTDTPALMTDISDFDGQSKSDTDEFAFVFVNKLT